MGFVYKKTNMCRLSCISNDSTAFFIMCANLIRTLTKQHKIRKLPRNKLN